MLPRLLLGGVAWLLALFLFGALIQRSGSDTPRVTPAIDGVDPVSRSINQARIASTHPERLRWTVTRSASALREMVVSVSAERPEQARVIAEQIIAPVHQQYEEILVYVSAVDSGRDPLVRRIAWTPRGGYRETSFK